MGLSCQSSTKMMHKESPHSVQKRKLRKVMMHDDDGDDIDKQATIFAATIT